MNGAGYNVRIVDAAVLKIYVICIQYTRGLLRPGASLLGREKGGVDEGGGGGGVTRQMVP